MSVQFDPPRGLNQAHLGAFWTRQKGRFPQVRALQPISPATELFGAQGPWSPPSLQFSLTNEPDCRLQLFSADDQWLCQIQVNRLVINWRKRTDDYPRFGAAWRRFRDIWRDWGAFLEDSGLPPAKPHLWDVTYVNRIPQGNLWQDAADWPKVFPGLWGTAFTTVPGADFRGFHGQWVWESPDPPARLYIEPRPGRSDLHAQQLLLLNLTARGPITSPTDDAEANRPMAIDRIASGMEYGHRLIVSAFDTIASPIAKTEWGRHADHD